MTRIIEEESGTYSGTEHSHNGYYAGDHSRPVSTRQPLTPSHTAVEKQS